MLQKPRNGANCRNSTDVNFIASQALERSQQQQSAGQDADGEGADESADAMAALERQARAPVGFVAASSGPEGGTRAPEQQQPAVTTNPDALEIDMDED